MRLWYLAHRRPAKAQANLRIRTVSSESSLFAHMKYGSRRRARPKIRHQALLDGCACWWRMSLRRMKSAIILWDGSYNVSDKRAFRPACQFLETVKNKSSHHALPKMNQVFLSLCLWSCFASGNKQPNVWDYNGRHTICWNCQHLAQVTIPAKPVHALSIIWTASSEFGTYLLCEQRRFRRACASAQSRQNLRCSLIQAVSQGEPSDRKPDPWPLWMAGHAQLKFVMTKCSKTQIRLTGLIYCSINPFYVELCNFKPWIENL